MRVMQVGKYQCGVVSTGELLSKAYGAESVNLDKYEWFDKRDRKLLRKAKNAGLGAVMSAPYSMTKLLQLANDKDGYQYGCVDAIASTTILQVECKNANVKSWLKDAQFPGNETIGSMLNEFVFNRTACGNGILIKMRNRAGAWAGLDRLLPSETQILENYDEMGFLRPDYMQVKSGKKKLFLNKDIIHFKKKTYKSNAWGLSCLPVAINVEILGEIKTFDNNNFSNGLLLDFIVIVEGGTLKSEEKQVNDDGDVTEADVYSTLQTVFRAAKGNTGSHVIPLIESENKDVKIKIEPFRQKYEGGFIDLKKDLREEIFAYHRTPARIVSQLVSGQLGGSDNADMKMFYHFVISPQQMRIAEIMSMEFKKEFGWNIDPADWDFGDLTSLFQTDDEKAFNSLKEA